MVPYGVLGFLRVLWDFLGSLGPLRFLRTPYDFFGLFRIPLNSLPCILGLNGLVIMKMWPWVHSIRQGRLQVWT